MRHVTYAVAAILAVGSVGVGGCKEDSSGKTVGQKVGETVDKANAGVKSAATQTADAAVNAKNAVVEKVTPSGSDDQSGMRGAMEGIVQNALGNDRFKTMTNHLVDADKTRLEATTMDVADLNAAVDQFKKNWKDKYTDPAFGAMDKDKVFAADFVALTAMTEGDAKKGKATIKASHGMPELNLMFVSQGGKWRLDTPDTLTPETLKTKLIAAVNEINKDPSTWPADKNDATRLVAHKILMVVGGM